jgi:hypothetical protein
MPGIDDHARDELRLSLQVVPRWRLSDDGWRTIEQRLRDVREAVERDDRIALYRHLEELDRSAPTRLASLSPDADASPAESTAPPDPVLELVNSLVHAPGAGEPGTR